MWIAADEPNVADWTSAIGQALGALFTAAAVMVALWLAVRERRWRREEQADRDAAQARLVTVELEYDSVDYDIRVFRVWITNHSSDPVFAVDLYEVESSKHGRHPWRIDYGPHEQEWLIADPVLTAGSRTAFPVAHVSEHGDNISLSGRDHATVGFTDAKGLRWHRTGPAQPVRIVDATSK